MTKINMYWKEDGTKVKSHTRGVKRVSKARKGLGLGKKLTLIGCATFFILSWMLCYENAKPNNISRTVTDVIYPENIAYASDFESADIPAYTDLYDKYFKDKAPEARKIAQCESGNRDIKSKMNKNGTYDYGRMQVNSLWLEVYDLKPSDLLQEETNIATAKKIYDRSGNFNAWSSSRKCHGL